MFASDAKAREIARTALSRESDKQVDGELRQFLVMPFMHSEDLADQELCVRLAKDLPADTLRYAVQHMDIIERFGRFPHRNAVLARATTVEEQCFSDEGGFSGEPLIWGTDGRLLWVKSSRSALGTDSGQESASMVQCAAGRRKLPVHARSNKESTTWLSSQLREQVPPTRVSPKRNFTRRWPA